jgi:DNA replication protein DnaC
MNQLLKTDLFLLDDWGMQKVTSQQRQDLMEVIEDRHQRDGRVQTGHERRNERSR